MRRQPLVDKRVVGVEQGEGRPVVRTMLPKKSSVGHETLPKIVVETGEPIEVGTDVWQITAARATDPRSSSPGRPTAVGEHPANLLLEHA